MPETIAVSLGTSNGLPFVASLNDETPHAQIYGSNWERYTVRLLEDMMENYSSQEIEFISTGTDMNGLLMSTENYMDYMNTISWGESTDYLTSELERRLGLFEHNNARNLREYADRVEDLPALVVLVDAWTDDVQIIHDLGKNTGVHLICGLYTEIPADVNGLAFTVDAESYNKATVRYEGSTTLIDW